MRLFQGLSMDNFKPETKGLLHSIQSFGALDGPGLRTVVVLQGCQFKCKFCHSIDTTLTDRGEEISAEELIKRILKNKEYWKKYTNNQSTDGSVKIDPITDPTIRGGVTITGGDPAVQPEFTKQLLIGLKEAGVHIAVESPLLLSQAVIDAWLPYVDLWMISLKHMDNDKMIELTGKGNERIFENIKYLDQKLTGTTGKIRFRYVVMPGLYDDEVHIKQIGRFVNNVRNLEKLELLKYTSMGKFKWLELFGKYELEEIPDATNDDIKRVEGYLEKARSERREPLSINL